MRKKICFVTTIPGTIKQFLLGLALHMIEHHDYDVTFISNDDDYLKSLCNENFHFIPVRMKRGVGFDGVRVIYQLYMIFKKGDYDIVQFATPNASFYASIASRMAGVKNRLYNQWGVRYMGFTGLPRYLTKFMIKAICSNASIIEVESYSIMKFCIEEKLYRPEKASVIWNGSANGVDLKKFDYKMRQEWRCEIREKFGIPEEKIVFGFAGRLNRDKGINELVEAFSIIKNPERATLLLVGDYDDVGISVTPENVDKIEHSDNIIHAPFTKEVEKYFAAMDVFCSLSYREGFGLVVIQAAAMGAPGVVSNVPGQFDTIINGKTGVLAEVKDIMNTKKALEYYMDNPEKIHEYGKNAIKHVQDNYDDTILLEKLANHRDEIIDKNR